jgi:hypothetical protein
MQLDWEEMPPQGAKAWACPRKGVRFIRTHVRGTPTVPTCHPPEGHSADDAQGGTVGVSYLLCTRGGVARTPHPRHAKASELLGDISPRFTRLRLSPREPGKTNVSLQRGRKEPINQRRKQNIQATRKIIPNLPGRPLHELPLPRA